MNYQLGIKNWKLIFNSSLPALASEKKRAGWWKIVPFCLLILFGCGNPNTYSTELMSQQNTLRSFPENLVIAHRGTTFWAPEETEAAMRWARNSGAHYLELDLQRTKDGYLIALHDDNLQRTTDISVKFPDRKDLPVSAFTYAELLTLDAGSWFNFSNPQRARSAFQGLDILTLEDVVRIAEGKRIKRNTDGKRIISKNEEGRIVTHYEADPAENGNRPGIYIETKVPDLFPGIEQDLKNELTRLGCYNEDPAKLKSETVELGKVAVAASKERIILQTFSKESLIKLNETFAGTVPVCFLLWRGNGADDLPDDRTETYRNWVEFGKLHGADIIGPSIAGEPNNYPNLLKPEYYRIIRESGLLIHAYSFDTWEQMKEYGARTDGMFTNRAEETILYYQGGKKVDNSGEKILEDLGY